MRVYIIAEQSSRAGIYGVGTYIRSLCDCVEYCGYRCSIIHLGSEKKSLIVEKDGLGVEHFYFPEIEGMKETPIYYKSIVYILRDLIADREERSFFHLSSHAQLWMIRELRSYFPDCVVLYSIHYFNWIFSLSGSTNYLNDILSGNDQAWNAHFAKCIRNDFRQEQILFRKVDKVLCLSRFAYNVVTTIAGIDPNQLFLVYNGLKDERIVRSLEDIQRIKKKYNLPLHEKIILFAGRLDQVKGVVHIIKAYKELKKEYTDCHLVMIGEGDFPYYLEIAEETCGSILFTGRLAKDKLYELYSIADFGVMQSFHEQCSYVGIEMMMHALPIIGTNSSGLDEMIVEGETGLKLPVIEQNNSADVDIDLLKDKMLVLLQNSERREYMSQKARERFEKCYSIEVMEQKMSYLYKSFVSVFPLNDI